MSVLIRTYYPLIRMKENRLARKWCLLYLIILYSFYRNHIII